MNVTHQQYLDMLMRLNRGRGLKDESQKIGVPVEEESSLHDGIIKFCKERKWAYWHGSMAHKTYRTPGEPDFTICADRARVFFIECKSRRGKLSPAQLATKVWLESLGHTVHVIDNMEAFRSLVL